MNKAAVVVVVLAVLVALLMMSGVGSASADAGGDSSAPKAVVAVRTHMHGVAPIVAYDPLYPPNEYPENPSCAHGYYSPMFNSVLNARCAGCFGAATQPTGSISEGTLPLFYNHSYNSVSEMSPDARNQRWYGPHSGYLN